MKSEILNTANIFGMAAYLSDLEHLPGHDELLLRLLEEIPITDTYSVVAAWMSGWEMAQSNDKNFQGEKKCCV